MSASKDNVKQRRNENTLRNLPSEVLLKARTTLFSLGGALKPRQDQPKRKEKDRKSHEKLKNSRSEPEFNDARKKHRSLIDQERREYAGPKPRPLSVGATNKYDKEFGDFHGSYQNNTPFQRRYDSTEEMGAQSRLPMPAMDRLSVQDQDERPRKKLSFREPEIVTGSSATLGRSNKLMGVNSLVKRPNRISLRNEPLYSSLERLDSDLESQAMKIVRTVGQAFEVCHKMQLNTPEQPAPSTSSAVDEPYSSDNASESHKEPAPDGVSESGAGSTKVVVEMVGERPKHLELLPPPPRKENRRSPQRTTPAPSINLPDLPECVTKVDITDNIEEGATPLSSQHQLQLLHERLEQQAQQTRAAVAQLLLLRDQLAVEQAARCEAQARTHQLLVHNKELLEHIAALVAHLQDRERGSSRPISAQQLTLLPQCCKNPAKNEGGTERPKGSTTNLNPTCNGNHQLDSDALLDLIAQTTKLNQNFENNNIGHSPFSFSPIYPSTLNGPSSAPSFSGMSNEQVQAYLISKFQDMGGFPNQEVKRNHNQQYYQNSKAFPNIPPLTNHYSNSDLASLSNHKAYKECNVEELSALARTMSVGQSDNSLYSTSQATTSKDSIPDICGSDEVSFIMPLSHNGTLTATGEDGRVRLIVPVSPTSSSSNVPELHVTEPSSSGATLKVPTGSNLAMGAPITRSTSEKVPNRSEMMTALRSQWTRHTTK